MLYTLIHKCLPATLSSTFWAVFVTAFCKRNSCSLLPRFSSALRNNKSCIRSRAHCVLSGWDFIAATASATGYGTCRNVKFLSNNWLVYRLLCNGIGGNSFEIKYALVFGLLFQYETKKCLNNPTLLGSFSARQKYNTKLYFIHSFPDFIHISMTYLVLYSQQRIC